MIFVKSVCFIPARGDSKGIPYKNIRLLGNIPLIAHTIQNSINSGFFDHVIVSTNSPKIAKIAKKYGAEVPFIRPKNLVTTTTTFDDVLLHLSSVTYVNKIEDLSKIIRNVLNQKVNLSSVSDYVEFIKKNYIQFDNAAFGINFNNKFYEGISKFKSVLVSDVEEFLKSHNSLFKTLTSKYLTIIDDYLKRK